MNIAEHVLSELELSSISADKYAKERSFVMISLDDIRFEYKFREQVEHFFPSFVFIAPLKGKTVKINGLKCSHIQEDNCIKIELDYEEVK